jgi:hypothetical protein
MIHSPLLIVERVEDVSFLRNATTDAAAAGCAH